MMHTSLHIILTAVVVYSTRAEVKISFPQFTSFRSFAIAVSQIPYPRGYTRIDLALKKVAEEVFSIDGGARSNVPKILIVMTDGYQTRTADSIPLDKAVLPLRAKGVQVYALAIGQFVKEYELRLLVQKPAHVFRSSRFSTLSSVISGLATTTCKNGECVMKFVSNGKNNKFEIHY